MLWPSIISLYMSESVLCFDMKDCELVWQMYGHYDEDKKDYSVSYDSVGGNNIKDSTRVNYNDDNSITVFCYLANICHIETLLRDMPIWIHQLSCFSKTLEILSS